MNNMIELAKQQVKETVTVSYTHLFSYPCSSIAFATEALSYWLTLHPKVCMVYLIISLP